MSSLVLGACAGTPDAGSDEFRGSLPVEVRCPFVNLDDGAEDCWQGEYVVLLADTGKSRWAAIVINDDWNWPKVEQNLAGWRAMVAAANDGNGS